VRYLHDEAQTLPEVLAANRIGRPPLLVGHSDGASIAILHAGAGHPVAGLVLIAPHVFVDQEAVASITAIRDGFASSELPAKMARYHVAAETTFHGWAEVWLSDGFRTWNIEEYLPGIDRPVLLVQGTEDEYGTERQLEAIESAVRGPVRRLMVEGAAHSPHLSHPEVVVPAVAEFIAEVA
ncbi:MAG: alpha/beta hydrolase, partial [Actinobacteria bacterium]